MKLLSLLPLMLLIGCPSAPKDSDSTDTGTTPLTDEDGDGFTSDVDCDDTLADVNPDAPEICDGVDNDCDGQIDGASATDAGTWYEDGDGDGYGSPDSLTTDCAQPAGYVADSTDCDDADAGINPDATDDDCDGVDQNCDGVPDDGAGGSSAWYLDADGDGFGDPATEMILCEEPVGYITDGSDCDDSDADINPDALEVCDGVDQDCDGTVDDDAADAPLWYSDGDRDGYGTGEGFRSCLQPPDVSGIGGDCDDTDPAYNPGADETCDGTVDFNCDGSVGSDDRDADGVLACDDCNDGDAAINPSATEVCDGADNDCDGTVDVNAADATDWYMDGDTDGYGDPATTITACSALPGYVADGGDCDDSDDTIHPGAAELCDSVDTDCDGLTDDPDSTDALTWYADVDADTYGDPAVSTTACSQPSGYSADDTDCDDSSAGSYPGADEYCDGDDNDCNGTVDDDYALDAPTWYDDADGDGYGDASVYTVACDAPTGTVADDTDCDDATATTYPGATEYCDGVDSDCNGTLDDDYAADAPTWYADSDADTWGDINVTQDACDQPSGYVADSTDCDDSSAGSYPGATEYCDGEDNDCNGTVDDSYAVDAPTWYADADADSYGDLASSQRACSQPAGTVSDATDCDDGSAAVNPAAAEVCNSIDDNCDAVTDTDATDRATWYLDGDTDGYGTTSTLSCTQPAGYASAGGDCDDASGTVHPNAADICENSIDEDCDGEDDCQLSGDGTDTDATTTIYGLSASDLVGQGNSIAGGDVNGDSFDDLIIGAEGYDSSAAATNRGRAYVLFGGAAGVASSLSSANAIFTGPVNGDGAGRSVGVLPDIDGDGDNELIIGQYKADNGAATNAGIVNVILGGSLSGDTSLVAASSWLLVKGGRTEDQAGTIVSAGDMDNDGKGDLLIGVPNHDLSATIANGGRVALYAGNTASGTYVIGTTQTATFTPSGAASTNAYFGSAVDGRGDYNGDGYDDILIGAYGTSSGTGAAYVFFGPQAGSIGASTANVTFGGAAAGDELGNSVAFVGDVDDDGYGDLVIGAHKRDTSVADAGVALYYRGAVVPGAAPTVSTADATIQGVVASDFAGRQVSGLGDVNADGFADLIVSATGYDGAFTGGGIASLFYGPLPTGTWSIDAGDTTSEGSRASEAAGSALAGVGDLDNDGYNEVVFGASGAQNAGVATGAGYVFYGTGE